MISSLRWVFSRSNNRDNETLADRRVKKSLKIESNEKIRPKSNTMQHLIKASVYEYP
jgi:hypothetical protein